ncbi:MAG: methyltransferase domain-containing protein [Myxococcales bacterium]|nr:methyltransferase domain-containing protein [Myxococcales bacterium]
MSDTARLRRARVVRIYDALDTTVLLGPDGRAHQLHAETAQLAQVLLRFLLEPRSRREVVEHVEALTGATLGEDSVVDQLLGLLLDSGAVEWVEPKGGAPATAPLRCHDRVVLCLAGGVAAMHAPALIARLLGRGFEVRVAATKNALRFINTYSIERLVHHPVAADMYEGETPVPHIDLATWADAVLVWPATGTTLSRLATGDFDSLVSAITLATSAPVVVAPSMNAGMYARPAVQRNIEQLAKDGMHVIHPSFGTEVADPPLDRPEKLGPAPPVGVVVQMLETALALHRAGKKRAPRSGSEWDDVYTSERPERLPWYTDAIDADLLAAFERLAPRQCFVLDIGTGLGPMAAAAAERGHRVVAIDVSRRALEEARSRAPELPVLWLEDDITNSHLRRQFDLAVDRGCLHLLTPDAAARYARNVAALLAPGGSLLLKTHASEEGSRHGTTPHTRQTLEQLFGGGFEIVEDHASTFPGPGQTPAARLFVLRRKSSDFAP